MTRKRRHIAGLIVALAAVAVAVAAALYWRYAVSSYDGDEPRWIYVPDGSTPESIAATLRDSLGSTGKKAATLLRVAGSKPESAHGAYRVEPGTTPLQLYRRLSRGIQTPVKLTFHNLRTVNQLASRVASRLEIDSARFMHACDSLLPPKGFKRAQYAAAFLPDSYEFYWTATPEKVVETLTKHRDSFWNPQRRAKAAALGLTPVETATIASIAEEETNDRKERGTVGRLYLNRLKKGMKLQADPTVKYAVGDFSLRRITAKHLAVVSPYNTYQVTGLPPGPIRIADAATIDALLDSKPHAYLYMCAKEDFSGRHNFATTYTQHQANAARYHKALNRLNIK